MEAALRKLPAEFVQRLQKIVPSSKFQAVLATFAERRPTTFRINTLKIERLQFLSRLRDAYIKVKDVPWYNLAFILQDMKLREFQETPFYKDSLIYVQGLSSMIPVLVLAPQPGEKVLDLCAAPGSKTTQIACMAGNAAEIVAVEKVSVRCYKLLANLTMQQATSVKHFCMDGSYAWKKYPEYFDRVLVDAPCSSEGQFLAAEPSSFGYWRIQKIKEAAYKQKRLLTSALRCLKIGGTAVYSTCTFAPEENESVIDWAVKTFKDQIEIVPIALRVPEVMVCGLSSWEGRIFDPVVRNTIRILPNHSMEGFFCALIRKTAEITDQRFD